MQFLWLKWIRASPDILPADCRDRNCHTHSGEQRFPGSPLHWAAPSIPSTFLLQLLQPQAEEVTARDSMDSTAIGLLMGWPSCVAQVSWDDAPIDLSHSKKSNFRLPFSFSFYYSSFFFSLTSRIGGLIHPHFSTQTIMASHQPWVLDRSSW